MCGRELLGPCTLDEKQWEVEETDLERHDVEKVRGLAGAALCEMKDLGIAYPKLVGFEI